MYFNIVHGLYNVYSIKSSNQSQMLKLNSHLGIDGINDVLSNVGMLDGN